MPPKSAFERDFPARSTGSAVRRISDAISQQSTIFDHSSVQSNPTQGTLSLMTKRAVILAGGKGTRLRPYTIALPKPLVPVSDTPILEIVIQQLARYGFDHITMAVNHQAEIIKAFFRDGARWNIRIDYSQETETLGTMGPLSLIDGLPENFLVMNGDILTDLDFGD